MTNNLWDDERQALRELLKELRTEKAGLTQTELSQALGRPQSYVSKYENGERRLDYVELYNICRALDVAMEDFDRLYEKRIQR